MSEPLDFSKEGTLLDFASGGEPILPDFSEGGIPVGIGGPEGAPQLVAGENPGVIKRLARGAKKLIGPLFEPPEEERLANAVRLTEPDGTVRYEYKPLAPLVEREGLRALVAKADPEASIPEKLARGAVRGVVGTVDAVLNPLLLALGPLSQSAPILHRAVNAGFAAHMLSQLPDVVSTLNDAVKSKDWETASEALTSTGLMAYFTYRGVKEAVKPGLVQESPQLKEMLTKKITEQYTPAQVREIYRKVNTGEATPAEAEFVRFLNVELERPGEGLRRGVTIESTEPRVQNERLRKWLGLDDALERTIISPSRKATAREPSVTEQPPTERTTDASIRESGPSGPLETPQAQSLQRVGAEVRPAEVGATAPITPEVAPPVVQGQALIEQPPPAGTPTTAAMIPPSPTAEAVSTAAAKHGEVDILGQRIKIEVAKGETRKGVDKATGEKWEKANFPAHYGKVLGVKGADGEPLDVFVGPTPDAENVFIVDQVDPFKDRAFDELKVMVGFDDPGAAMIAYMSSFTGQEGVERMGAMSVMSVPEFQEWIKTPENATKPLRFRSQVLPAPPRTKLPPPEMVSPHTAPEDSRLRREKLIKKAITDRINLMDLVPVEQAISRLQGHWSLQATNEAIRYGTAGQPAIRRLEEIAATTEPGNEALVKRAKDILRAIPRLRRAPLESEDTSQKYVDVLAVGKEITAESVLKTVMERTTEPHLTEVAKLLTERRIYPKVQVIRFDDWYDERLAQWGPDALERYFSAVAVYVNKTDAVSLFRPSWNRIEETLLHELVHAGTIEALDTDPGLYKEINDLFLIAHEHDEAPHHYGARANPLEFVAEAFTSKTFRKFISELPGQLEGETLLDSVMRVMTPRIEPQTPTYAAALKNPWTGENVAPVVAVTPAVAGRALVRAGIEQQLDFERTTQSVQVSTLLDLMERHGAGANNAVMQDLARDLMLIQAQTTGPRMTYAQFKAANPGAAYIPAVALEASLKLMLERDKWKKLRVQLGEQETLISSKTFWRKIEKLETKAIQKESLETAWDNFRASLKDAIADAKRALQGEARNEERARQLLRQISSLESVEGYQIAMEHGIEAMVNALAQSPQVGTFLAQSNPSAQQIVAEYGRIRERLGLNPAASDIVIEWAGELLGRSWAEAQRMILSALVRDNVKLQKDMTAYERSIFKGLRDKPKQTVGEILKEAGKISKANALTKLAWSRLRQEVSRELERWDELQQAVSVLDKVEADPEYKAHANAVFKDAKIEDRPDAVVRLGEKNVSVRELNYDAIAGSPIFPMPDGTVVQVHLVGDVKAFAAERKKMEAALEKLMDWKEQQDALAEAQRDPSYGFFVGHLRALEGIYLSTRVTHPSSLVSIGNPFSAEQPGSWDMPTFLLDDLGTRVGGAAKVAASNFNRVHALGRNLLVGQHDLANAQYDAANSYKFKGSQNERAIQLYDHVLQPLFAAAQRPGFKLQVGMVVGEGHVVTKEVVALLKLQRELAEQAFKIVQERVPGERPTSAFAPVIKDQLHGVLFHGQSIAVNETTLPFGGWNERATSFVEDYIAKKRRGDVQAAVLGLANNYDLIFSYLADRASIVELGESPFEHAYDLLVRRLRATPPTTTQRNLKWVSEQVAAINGADPKDVIQQMASELDGLIEHVSAMRRMEEESDPTVALSQPHQETSFTARRHDRSVPYHFVRYGFRTGANFLDFIGNVHAHAFERFIEALGEVQRDLERQRDELSVRYDQRLQELLTGGTPAPKAKRKAMKDVKFANALAHLNGQTTDQFRSLEKRLRQVRKAIQSQKDVFTGNREAEMDIRTWTKVSRAVVGSLLTPITVLIKNGTGLPYLGAQMARMRRNAGISSVDVATRIVWDGLVKQGVAAPVFKALKYAMGRGGMKPWFEAIQARLDRNQGLEEAGLTSPIDIVNEVIAKFRNLENSGIVLDDKRGAGERVILGMLGLFDSLVLTAVAKPIFPRLGDKIINAASDSATVAMVKELENRLRELFKLWSDAGKLDSRFDFNNPTSEKNVLSHEEIFPSALFGTSSRQKLEYLRQTFEWSGTTFDRAAFDFLQKLRAGEKSPLLNEEQMIGVKDQVLASVNVPHALNRPAWTHQRDIFHSLFAPLVGWNIHALRQFVRYFSRPGVAPGESRASMWFVMGMVLLPVLLAMMATQDMATEELIRLVYLGMGKERSTRQPWEQPPEKVATALLVSALNPVPYVSMAVNTALNDSPTRASFDPTPVLINKAKDIATYIGGVVQTGNPQHGLERLISSLVPIVAPALAQMPSQEGIQDSLNARRLLTRHGEPDLLRPKYTGSQPATPLTPFGQKMMNAAMTGNDGAFQEAYNAAVAEARAMGKPNPEATVKSIFQAQNIYNRAFKAKLSPEQRASLLAKLDPRERAIVENAERRFEHAGALLGLEPTFQRETPSRGGSRLGGFARRRSRIGRGRRPRLSRGRRVRLGSGRRSRLRRGRGIRRLSRGLRV